MRATIYGWLLRLPVKLFGALTTALGLASSLAPERVQTLVGSAVTVEAIEQVGIFLLIAAFLYVFVLLLLKPSAPSGSGGITYNTGPHFHGPYDGLEKLLGERLGTAVATPEPTQVQPHDSTHHHEATGALVGGGSKISGTASIGFEVTGAATGVTGLHGLYVGQIIVAAGSLANENRLDIAIRGYNGTGETIRLCDVRGHVRADVGDMRDPSHLPLPELKGAPKAKPGEEFLIALLQPVSSDLASEFLRAWEEGGRVSLDLRNLSIDAIAIENPAKIGRLPLWDGVNLRRRDDIVTNRNHIVALSEVIRSQTKFFPPTITQSDPSEKLDEPD